MRRPSTDTTSVALPVPRPGWAAHRERRGAVHRRDDAPTGRDPGEGGPAPAREYRAGSGGHPDAPGNLHFAPYRRAPATRTGKPGGARGRQIVNGATPP